MKFRRNAKDEKIFKIAAIFFLVLFIIFLLIYLFTNKVLSIQFGSVSVLIIPLYFYISYTLKNSFIEFKSDQIILINHKNNNIVIELSEINEILIPSQKALKNKFKANNIIIKRKDIHNVISYSKEIEEYIIENLKANILYYDNYSKVIK